MLNVLKTLLQGASARAEERLTDHFAIDLIEQKIREAEAGLAAAKQTLASLIVRQRTEDRALTSVQIRIHDLESRARLALADGREDLAATAAAAIAELENERTVRQATLAQLGDRIARTRSAVEKANRRIIDLKQGMISARSVDAERKAQKKLDRAIGSTAAVREAEEMILRIMAQDEPREEAEVLDEIDADLDGRTAATRLGDAGYGARTRVTTDDVLARLRTPQPTQNLNP
jgi:phage shock protein A